jgi:hypothetical protein
MEYDRRKEDREVKHITLKEKKRAAEIALSGESPLKYLQSLGVRNPTSTWKTIRTYYEKNDPETYAKLPVSGNVKKPPEKPAEPEAEPEAEAEKVEQGQRPRRIVAVGESWTEDELKAIAEKTGGEVISEKEAVGEGLQGMADAANRFFGACEEMGLAISAKYSHEPMEYETTAIMVKGLGEFYFDRKFNSIDWRALDGAETSLTPDGWRQLHDAIPDILATLHANGEKVAEE